MTNIIDTLSKELDKADTVGTSHKVAIKALRELEQVTSDYEQLKKYRRVAATQHLKDTEALREVKNVSERLAYLLNRVMTDLPQNKDWLDPAVEREAKELLKELQN